MSKYITLLESQDLSAVSVRGRFKLVFEVSQQLGRTGADRTRRWYSQ